VSIRVTDPGGEIWVVSRDWFGFPRWTRFEGGAPADLPWADGIAGDDVGGLAVAIVVLVAVLLVLVVLWFVVLPLVVFVTGVIVALLALAARLLSISAWTIRARNGDRQLSWRVRGTMRSGRAMRQVAARIGRGEEPTIDGTPGAAGDLA
jgi:hypothetical protein